MPHLRPPSRLFALSFDAPASPSIEFPGLTSDETLSAPYGWGLAWYPERSRSARSLRESSAIGETASARFLSTPERFQTELAVGHVRGTARQGGPDDAQPFVRAYAGRDWTFAHAGDLSGDHANRLPLATGGVLEPVGRSDSEHLFCWILSLLQEHKIRTLEEFGWERLHQALQMANDLGTMTVLMSDGRDLIAYQDRDMSCALCRTRRIAGSRDRELRGEDVAIRFGHVAAARTFVALASEPLSDEVWARMQPGQLLVIRQGAVVWDSHSGAVPIIGSAPPMLRFPYRATPRTLDITHETVYRYATPVERSTHLLRLMPVQDARQMLLAYDMQCSVRGLQQHYDDVFGNAVLRLSLANPFTELRIVSRSRVHVTPPTPFERALPRRMALPLVWMPSQRQMMQPYLLPPELTDAELSALSDYAMGTVRRRRSDLAETIADLNETIYRDFQYVPGVTHVETTPWEVFTSHRGVCQDFANLLICLLRLLNVPARYRVGYIFTGTDYANTLQSEASHAWVELYVPEYGWLGVDPTNGTFVSADHVRVASGRNYRDAAPTSGTIYAGGGPETLYVSVRVEEADPAVPFATATAPLEV
jgi:transglutaminase-like putative cysteine protease/predicted glutamine amidotransferase